MTLPKINNILLLKENNFLLRINRKGQKCQTTNHIGGKNKKDEK